MEKNTPSKAASTPPNSTLDPFQAFEERALAEILKASGPKLNESFVSFLNSPSSGQKILRDSVATRASAIFGASQQSWHEMCANMAKSFEISIAAWASTTAAELQKLSEAKANAAHRMQWIAAITLSTMCCALIGLIWSILAQNRSSAAQILELQTALRLERRSVVEAKASAVKAQERASQSQSIMSSVGLMLAPDGAWYVPKKEYPVRYSGSQPLLQLTTPRNP